jgi:hypothetical protein
LRLGCLRKRKAMACVSSAMADEGMAEAKKTIVASGYKQVGSRATPEAITKEIKKLPAASGMLDSRKRALHDLAHALAYVQENHKETVCNNCKTEQCVFHLIMLLNDIDAAPALPASEDVIRVGRRVLGMGPMDARLYVLSCFVNLAYLGGAGQLRLPPDGVDKSAMEVLFDTLLLTQESESVLFYSVAGLYNLSNDASFAQMAATKKGVLAKLHSLAESANPDTVKYASGTVDNWRKHHSGAWPPQ